MPNYFQRKILSLEKLTKYLDIIKCNCLGLYK